MATTATLNPRFTSTPAPSESRQARAAINVGDAERMLSIVGNDQLAPIAARVRDKLARVIDRAAER